MLVWKQDHHGHHLYDGGGGEGEGDGGGGGLETRDVETGNWYCWILLLK